MRYNYYLEGIEEGVSTYAYVYESRLDKENKEDTNIVPTGERFMTHDYYKYVVEMVAKNGSLMFYCHGDYSWLFDAEEGAKKTL